MMSSCVEWAGYTEKQKCQTKTTSVILNGFGNVMSTDVVDISFV